MSGRELKRRGLDGMAARFVFPTLCLWSAERTLLAAYQQNVPEEWDDGRCFDEDLTTLSTVRRAGGRWHRTCMLFETMLSSFRP